MLVAAYLAVSSAEVREVEEIYGVTTLPRRATGEHMSADRGGCRGGDAEGDAPGDRGICLDGPGGFVADALVDLIEPPGRRLDREVVVARPAAGVHPDAPERGQLLL